MTLPGRDFITGLYQGIQSHPQNSSEEIDVCILHKVSEGTNICPNIFQSTENTSEDKKCILFFESSNVHFFSIHTKRTEIFLYIRIYKNPKIISSLLAKA